MQSGDENKLEKEVYQCRGLKRTNVNIEIDGHPTDSWLAPVSVVLQPSNSAIVEGVGFEILDENNQVIQKFPNLQAAREWLEKNGCTLKGQ